VKNINPKNKDSPDADIPLMLHPSADGLIALDNGYYLFFIDYTCGGEYLYFGTYCKEIPINGRLSMFDCKSIKLDFPNEELNSKFKSFCENKSIPFDTFGTYIFTWYTQDV